jgi:hypothetical protein
VGGKSHYFWHLAPVPDTPPRRAPSAATLILSSQAQPDIEEDEEEEEMAKKEEEERKKKEEEEEEEEEILPSSTAPAILSRAGRKRARRASGCFIGIWSSFPLLRYFHITMGILSLPVVSMGVSLSH